MNKYYFFLTEIMLYDLVEREEVLPGVLDARGRGHQPEDVGAGGVATHLHRQHVARGQHHLQVNHGAVALLEAERGFLIESGRLYNSQ